MTTADDVDADNNDYDDDSNVDYWRTLPWVVAAELQVE